ncbi:hypothetical protein DUI87_15546 [Hirundo rustica rustica]|uniref:Uncharacterized protein n=1 Tax=Hirundo rustica rustica TaxID=333673 RepID=A0A3M0JYR3_HIRRU|nr:hypothetical protein DUI87_15546 [Hirundo rustica rustica]
MDSHSSSSCELPERQGVSRYLKVLEWLVVHFPNNYGAEEEEEDQAVRRQRQSPLEWCSDDVEDQWQDLLDAMSILLSSDDDEVLSKGKHCGAQEVSQGEAGIQDNIWNKPLGLVDDAEPLEGPSCSRCVGTEETAESARALPSASPALWSPMVTELAAASPTGATEEEEPPELLASQAEEAPCVVSDEAPSTGTQSPHSVTSTTPASSLTSLDGEQSINREILSQALRQQMTGVCALQRCLAVEVPSAVTGGREESPVPAPHGPPSPRPDPLGAQALRGQPPAPRKRPSRFRRALRALRALFRASCMRPRPEE